MLDHPKWKDLFVGKPFTSERALHQERQELSHYTQYRIIAPEYHSRPLQARQVLTVQYHCWGMLQQLIKCILTCSNWAGVILNRLQMAEELIPPANTN